METTAALTAQKQTNMPCGLSSAAERHKPDEISCFLQLILVAFLRDM